MYLEIITPEQTLFKGEVDSVLFPGSLGDFQVLNNHAPIVSTLKKGEVKIIGKLNLDSSVKDQFEISDERSPKEIAQMIQNQGYEPVWKDWDKFL